MNLLSITLCSTNHQKLRMGLLVSIALRKCALHIFQHDVLLQLQFRLWAVNALSTGALTGTSCYLLIMKPRSLT